MLKFYPLNQALQLRKLNTTRKLFAVLLCGLFSIAGANAQTTLISPTTNNGGFESGTTGWTFAQNTASTTNANRWEVGAVSVPYAGTNAAYITTGATGFPYSYGTGTARTSHMYRDVTFPAGETNINLSFYWKGNGESGWDRLLVYLAPTTVTPTAGSPASSSTALTGATLLYTQTTFPQSSYGLQNIVITAAQAGNATASSTMRLIFTWQNDGGGGTAPGASVDDISLISICTGATTAPASALTTTSATLNWNVFTGATGYQVRYKKVSDPITTTSWATPTSVTGGATTTLALSSLTASTLYEYQVAAVGASCTVFSSSATFTTLCTSASLTQVEGFNAATIPLCWSTTIVTPPLNTTAPAITYETSSSNATASPREGTRFVKFNSFNSQNSQIRLVSLPVNSTGAPSVQVSYLWFNDNNTSYNTGSYLLEGMQVQYSLNGTTWTDAGTFTQRSNITAGWVTKSVVLPAAANNATTLYVGFLFTSKFGDNCYMDSVAIGPGPSCNVPTNVTATPTSPTAATISWGVPAVGTPTGYEYVVSTTNTTPAGAGTPFSGTSTSVTVAANTTYYLFVRSACTGSTFSSWSAATTFTTPCSTSILPQFEGFNAVTMPSCWTTAIVTAPTNTTQPLITFETSGSNPTATVREGTRLVKFNSFNTNGSQIRLISLPLNATGAAGVEVNYLWFNDNNATYSTGNYLLEGMQVQYSLNGTTWVDAGSFIPRSNATGGWVKQSVILPAAVSNVANLQVGFLFTSKFGDNCFMDSVHIVALPPCSGTPTPGNTLSSSASACVGTPLVLSLQNATTGIGVTYQWESSTDGITYANVSTVPSTSATLSITQTVNTYYRAKVTCSGNTGTSTAIQVNMNNFLTCYCSLPAVSCSSSDVITNVTIGTLNNTTTCATNGYGNYTTGVDTTLLARGSTNNISVTVGAGGTENVYAWIDFNQNGVFEALEFTSLGSGNGTTITSSIPVPATATLGVTGMRVRLRFSSALTSADACLGGFSFGETEDYLVKIVPQTPSSTVSTQCGTATPGVSISSNSGATTPTYKWYLTATGGTAISGQSGATLSGYPISATTTFYVSEVISGIESMRRSVVATYNPQPEATISATTNVTCFGGNDGSATVTAAGGSGYNYSWNTTPAQTTATASGLTARSYIVTVTNSNSTCPATATAVITQPTAAASIPAIAAQPANATICANTNTSFTSTATGLNITYQWQENTGSGYVNVSNGGVYSNVTTSTLNITGAPVTMNGYQYRVMANGTCSPAAPSNGATLTVNMTVPSVSILSSATTICAGASVTFTATPVNGGTTPVYQWKKNGSNVTGSGNTYTTTTLANNDIITVDMTSNANCPIPALVTSNGITMTVNPVVTPTVSISASATTICAGTSVTFTANPGNGGSTPTYQWKKNNVNVGTNSSTYTDNALTNGNSITCVMTSSNPCPSVTTATSNAVVMTVNPILVPTISISSSVPSATICAGTSVTFTSAITNGGSAPAYSWRRNGTPVATGSSYTTTTLSNGDMITCNLSSSVPCPNPAVVTSNSITFTVNPYLTPAVVISANPGNTICAGTTVTYTATPINGGSTPAYQWKKNGVNVGNNSTYTTSSLVQGDIINCVLTTSLMCYTSLTGTSNNITMTVNPILVPSVSITVSDDTICDGATVTFTTNPVNPGSNPQYQWRKNGTTISGATGATYTTSTLQDNNAITCLMTSNALCASPTLVVSNTITMKVNPLLTPSVAITASTDTSLCTGELVMFTATSVNGGVVPGYQWTLNGNSMTGATFSTFSLNNLNNGDVVSLTMTSNAICPVPPVVFANSIKFRVDLTTPPQIFISAKPGNKIAEGDTVIFSAVILNAGTGGRLQWMKNDTAIASATGTTYRSSSLQNNDKISLIAYSTLPCSDPDSGISNSITIFYNTGVKALTENISDVRLYPNPNNGNFTLEAHFANIADDRNAKIEILNGLGQLVFKDNMEVYGGELKKQITLTGVANGIYYIRLSSGGQMAIKQMNIQQD